MSENNNIYTPKNIDVKNTIITGIVNQRYNKNALDDVRNLLDSVKEKSTLSSPESLVGLCLWSRMMTMEQFTAKYENMTTVYKLVTDKGQKASKTKSVLEAYVDVPEITGMLPRPDFSKIQEYLKMKKQGESSSIFERVSKEAQKEFEKITYFPRFYKAFDSITSVYTNRPVEVKSLSTSGFNTEAIGIFVRVLDNN